MVAHGVSRSACSIFERLLPAFFTALRFASAMTLAAGRTQLLFAAPFGSVPSALLAFAFATFIFLDRFGNSHFYASLLSHFLHDKLYHSTALFDNDFHFLPVGL